jgi:O-antigen ligase
MVCLALSLPFLDRETVYENRTDIWKSALLAGYEYPVTGWGVGNAEVAFKEYNTRLYNRLQGYYVDSSHNFILDWWVQGGVVGLGLVVLGLWDAGKRYIVSHDRHRLLLLLGIFTVSLFNPLSVVNLLHFWWLIGHGLGTVSRR